MSFWNDFFQSDDFAIFLAEHHLYFTLLLPDFILQ
jgi:hypothetical protein